MFVSAAPGRATRPLRSGLAAGLLAAAGLAQATMGFAELPATAADGPVTLYYPATAAEQPVARGRLTILMAPQAPPALGNGRLVVISHGSGGAPWVHADLARRLVGARAIDAVGRDGRFGPALDLARVGVYGMSAGGHTALSLAGGRWSAAAYRAHGLAHLAEDFQTCVGLTTRLTGGPLDGVKQWAARGVIGRRYDDATPQGLDDPRVAAVVAGVSLVAGVPTGGHGALLSPLPPGFTGLEADLLNDPPGFDRGQLPEVDAKIAAFFSRHLLK